MAGEIPAPPYYLPGSSPAAGFGSIHPHQYDLLCSCSGTGEEILLPLLRGLAWELAENRVRTWWGPSLPTPGLKEWMGVIAGLTGQNLELVLSLMDVLEIIEHGVSVRCPWLTDAGWRWLWAYEIREQEGI